MRLISVTKSQRDHL